MDVDEGGGDGMEDSEQFHRNKAIYALLDEDFLAEKEDDYEDLNNNFNVGKNFLQSPSRLQVAAPLAMTSVGERIEYDGAVSRGGLEVYQSYKGPGVPGGGDNGTFLFVGNLHWWTTDAELEEELCKYGPVQEVKFVDEKTNGKSKGYCKVKFDDPNHAAACKEGMNGHMFNGRPCVVEYASPHVNWKAKVNHGRKGPGDCRPGGADDNGRGYGRGNWGRGGGRGPVVPMMRNRGGGIGGRGLMGNGGTPPMMHSNSMMGQGYDPTFGGPMESGYEGHSGGPAPFPGLVENVGLLSVAPHGRGTMNGMGMMVNNSMDGGQHIGGWTSEEHNGGRAGESHARGA